MDKLSSFKLEALTEAVIFANAAGSFTTTKPGAIPAMSTEEEIKQLLQR